MSDNHDACGAKRSRQTTPNTDAASEADSAPHSTSDVDSQDVVPQRPSKMRQLLQKSAAWVCEQVAAGQPGAALRLQTAYSAAVNTLNLPMSEVRNKTADTVRRMLAGVAANEHAQAAPPPAAAPPAAAPPAAEAPPRAAELHAAFFAQHAALGTDLLSVLPQRGATYDEHPGWAEFAYGPWFAVQVGSHIVYYKNETLYTPYREYVLEHLQVRLYDYGL